MSGTDAISGAELRVWLGLSEGQFARLAEQFNHPVDASSRQFLAPQSPPAIGASGGGRITTAAAPAIPSTERTAA